MQQGTDGKRAGEGVCRADGPTRADVGSVGQERGQYRQEGGGWNREKESYSEGKEGSTSRRAEGYWEERREISREIVGWFLQGGTNSRNRVQAGRKGAERRDLLDWAQGMVTGNGRGAHGGEKGHRSSPD